MAKFKQVYEAVNSIQADDQTRKAVVEIIDHKVDDSFEKMRTYFEAKFAAMDTKFAAMDTKFAAMDTKFKGVEKISNIALSFSVATLIAILGLIVTILVKK